MPRNRYIQGLLLTLASGAAASIPVKPLPTKPACEPYVDTRELRYRAPTATIAGRVVAGSVHEIRPELPEFGMELVPGTATVRQDGGEREIVVSYAYWLANGGCSGWEPALGAAFVFDLADDAAKDGSLRVMRFGRNPDAVR